MRLRRSDVSGKGIRRQRSGKGFRYLAEDGDPVRDPELVDRIRALAVPPAWRDVWICPHPNGHIQAVGTDDAGRRQYLYHEHWRRSRDEEKHRRVVALAKRLPELRAAIDADLCTAGLGRTRVLAGALRMLDRGVFRTGGEEYAQDGKNGPGTRGVATLLRGDVTVQAGTIQFCYPAKGNIERRVQIRDPSLATLITALRRNRRDEDRLFTYREGKERRAVRAEDVNERLRELAGEEFSAKDLRTWHATVLAAVLVANEGPPPSARARKRTEKAMLTEVAEQLGNTPAVARRSYVDPRVLEAWERGDTISATLTRLPDDPSTLADDELRAAIDKAVIRLLDD